MIPNFSGDHLWEEINPSSPTAGGIQIWEHDWANNMCDTRVIVHELVDWDSDTVLVAGMFPWWGDKANGPTGDAWNLAFLSTGSAAFETVPSWAKTNGPIYELEAHDNDLYMAGDFTEVGAAQAASHVVRLQRSDNTWTWHALGTGTDGPVFALDYLTDNSTLYVGGDFGLAGGAGHYNIARWDEYNDEWPGGQFFYQFDVDASSWYTKTVLPTLAGVGACLSANNDGHIYALAGGGSGAFYRYSIAGNSWQALAGIADTHSGSALASADGTLYALPGGELQFLYHYTGSGWGVSGTGLAPSTSAGADLVWDGDDALHLLEGGGSDTWWRFRFSDGVWKQMDDPGLAAFAGFGRGLIRRDQSLYAYLSPVGEADSFYRSSRVGVSTTKLFLEGNAFIAHASAAAPVWLSPGALAADYDMDDAGNNTWVTDGAWTPSVAADNTLSHEDADLVNPSAGLFRTSRQTQLTCGYRPYKGEVRVSPTYCAICENDGLTWNVDAYDSIQTAIDTGANYVLLGPGVYREPFYLLSGAQVAGSGADYTLIEAPPSLVGPLVHAEGTAATGLSRLSLVGNGLSEGWRVEDGAKGVKASRLIVRDHETGIAVDGAATDLEVANDTVVENVDGIVFTGNADVDVRNTVLAYNQGIGLAYETGAVRKSHTYNDYWANGTDLAYLDDAATPDPGASEVFLDPLFLAMLSHDYRPLEHSPLVDGGAVNDPAPPGAGNRVDIGYSEHGRAAFYVDQGYGPREENHGLTWQSDAFETIQSALDAAAATVRALRGTPPDEGYTVNVAPGIYQEAPRVPSYAHLVGSGADETILQNPRDDGSTVVFDGVIGASLQGFEIPGTVEGGGSSHAVVQSTAAQYVSAGLSGSGLMQAAYMTGDITYASSSGGAWSHEMALDVDPSRVDTVVMELNGSDEPNIIYSQKVEGWQRGEALWLRRGSTGWYTTTVYNRYISPRIAMDLDPSGHPLIIWQRTGGDGKYYLHQVSWTGSAFEHSYFQGVSFNALAGYAATVSEAGRPRYAIAGDGGIWYAYRTYATSSVVYKNRIAYAQLLHDIQIESHGPGYTDERHILYGDATNHRLLHWRSGTGSETIDTGQGVGYYNAMALDGQGNVHVAYSKDGGLKYGFGKRNSGGSPSYLWSTKTIASPSDGDVGSLDIAVDDAGPVHVVYAVGAPANRVEHITFWGGADSNGVQVSGASHDIAIRRNVIHNLTHGIVFDTRSSGVASFNTLVDNGEAGVLARDAYTWVETENNLLAGNETGLRAQDGGQLFASYDLLHNATDADGVTLGDGMVYGDPQFGVDYYITADSPAVDAADPFAPVPVGGGIRADMGYKELIAAPLPLLFGQEICSTVTGNSGVAGSEVGVEPVTDPGVPVTETLPAVWSTVAPLSYGEAVSQWALAVTPPSEGLYRVYSRSRDVVGNDEADLDSQDWYAGAYVGDGTLPTVSWVTPTANTSTDGAALLLVAEASDYVDAGDGPRFAVDEIVFLVDGQPFEAEWEDDPDWDPSALEARRFRACIPLHAGTHTVQARARDSAGHLSHTSVLTVAATNPNHVATITSHVDGEAVRDRELHLRGYVRYASAGSGQLEVQVESQPPITATLGNPVGQLTAWRAAVDLPESDGSHTIELTPSLGTVGAVTSIQLVLDRAGPDLTLARPLEGEAVTSTITFEGTASEPSTESGLSRVEFSVDGGYTWIEIQRQAGPFALDYDIPIGEDSVSYPVRVRATDLAGNATVEGRIVSVDSQSPDGLAPTTFSAVPGMHLQRGYVLAFNWTPAVDASGSTVTYVAVDRSPDTLPTQVVTGTAHQANLDRFGEWYVHLAAEDAVGNTKVLHYGPWYLESVGQSTTTTSRVSNVELAQTGFAESRQSIILDGVLDVVHDEWLAGSEWLDDAQWHGLVQDLYAAWDGEALYLGYGGSWWDMDGDLWAYLDVTDTVGSAVSPVGEMPLPFTADWALQVVNPDTALLWEWTGAVWESELWGDWIMGTATGHTEIRLPWSTLTETVGSLALFVVALENDGEPGAVFPTTNPLGGPATDFHFWADVTTAPDPNAGQPMAHDASLALESDRSESALCGPNEEIVYQVTVRNDELREVSGLRVELTASAGLAFYGDIDPPGAATCVSCDGGAAWQLSLPTLAAGEVRQFVVTAQLDDDVTGVSSIACTASLTGSPVPVVDEPVVDISSNRVDGDPPTVGIDVSDGHPVPVGPWNSTGTASDGDGIGVSEVWVRVEAEAWQVVTGTLSWQATVDVPDVESGTTVTIEAYAVDAYGQVSSTETRTLLVDKIPPVLDFVAPEVSSPPVTTFEGTASDLAPVTGRVEIVEVQFDDESALWHPATVLEEPVERIQNWHYDWRVPWVEGEEHRVRARAIDLAGLVTTGSWYTTVVNLLPQVDAGDDATVDEGSAFVGPGSYTDPGDDPCTGAVDYGDGAVVLTLTLTSEETFELSHVYADDGEYIVTVTVTDVDGGEGSDTVVVTVLNVAPTVGPITVPVDPVQVNTKIDARAEFSDPGTLDTHTALWDWDSGDWGDSDTSVGTVVEEGGSGSVTGDHSYALPGVYALQLTVTDDDDGEGTEEYRYVVIYDPEGGFVTGGGAIDSPEGACPDFCGDATGEATFGFVSKYKKGAMVPTGQTQFQFEAGDLNFHSGSYEWLVIAGAKAKYKGVGIINGSGSYGFMLTALDADVNESDVHTVDSFRIKIWDRDDGDKVVYDNQMEESDGSDAASELQDGSIVIHSGKSTKSVDGPREVVGGPRGAIGGPQ